MNITISSCLLKFSLQPVSQYIAIATAQHVCTNFNFHAFVFRTGKVWYIQNFHLHRKLHYHNGWHNLFGHQHNFKWWCHTHNGHTCIYATCLHICTCVIMYLSVPWHPCSLPEHSITSVTVILVSRIVRGLGSALAQWRTSHRPSTQTLGCWQQCLCMKLDRCITSPVSTLSPWLTGTNMTMPPI